MFNKKVLKSIACVVLISYISVFSASNLSAAEWGFSVTPQLFAQASTPAAPSRTTPEEEKALRQIYDEKIERLEAEMNNARGTRNTLLTVAVTSFFIGAGILAGSSTVKSSVEDISTDTPEEEEDKDDAIQALDAVNGVGAGVIGVGGVSLLGYLLYTATIGSKQRRIDALRDELDARFQVRGLTPEYLQKNESVAAVVEEIELAKKSAGQSRTFQGFFSRIAIGSLLSGGFLFTLATAGRDVVEEINVDENDPEEVASRDDALDQTDTIETTGIALLGAGVACGVASFFFGRRAKGKEDQIDELENSLLRVAERIDIHPKSNGFMVMYTHQF